MLRNMCKCNRREGANGFVATTFLKLSSSLPDDILDLFYIYCKKIEKDYTIITYLVHKNNFKEIHIIFYYIHVKLDNSSNLWSVQFGILRNFYKF